MRCLAAAAVLVAALTIAWPRAVWLAVRGAVNALAVIVAAAVEHRRHRRSPPRPALPVPRCWHVRLSTQRDGILAEGPVVGPWTTARQVEAETRRRWADTPHAADYGPVQVTAWPAQVVTPGRR